MPHRVLDKLAAEWPAEDWRDTTVVIAVSGGPDSVALLRALHFLKSQAAGQGRLVAAHFNHGLRGAESDADQAFVAELCRDLHLACETNESFPGANTTNASTVRAGDAMSASHGHESEDQSRRVRYEFLRAVVARTGARFLATAHSADDQAETVLHRVMRGTGIPGLAGIPRVREFMTGVTLIRPLLTTWRHELMDYLVGLQQPFRQDSSNAAARFTRNRLRHELLPQLERDFNPRVKEALCRLAGLAREVTAIVNNRLRELEEQVILHRDAKELRLDCNRLDAAEPYLIRELFMNIWEMQGWPLQDMSLEKWTQLARLVARSTSRGTRLVLPGNIFVERAEAHLLLRRV